MLAKDHSPPCEGGEGGWSWPVHPPSLSSFKGDGRSFSTPLRQMSKVARMVGTGSGKILHLLFCSDPHLFHIP